MMALVEQDSPRCVLAGPRRIDHHQCVVGDHDVGLAARPFRALDEAPSIMRAAGIDAFAPPIGERRRAGPPEQARQPARQVAADHVAVFGIGGPPPHQLSQHRSTPAECALERVFEVQQAEIILAALADDDALRPFVGVREQFWPFAVKLTLQRLGEGRHPHCPARAFSPQGRRRQVGERLADAGTGLRQQHVGRALRRLGREHLGHRLGHRALPFSWLDPAGQLIELGPCICRIDEYCSGRRLFAGFLP